MLPFRSLISLAHALRPASLQHLRGLSLDQAGTSTSSQTTSTVGFAALDDKAHELANQQLQPPAEAPLEPSTSAPASIDATSTIWPFIDEARPMVLPRLVKKQRQEAVSLWDALEFVKKHSKRKFVETVEMHVKLKVDPRQGDQMVRGAVVLPFGTGKPTRVCVFATGAHAEAAAAAGADVVGDEALIQKILETKGSCIDFDKCVATPDFMKLLGKVGKILGPRGMMPNPKVGTMTIDVAGAVRDIRRGRLEYRVDKAAIVHMALGKVDFPMDHIFANIGSAAQSLIDTKPKVIRTPGLAGYIQKVHLCSTMGPSVPVIVSSLLPAIEAARSSASAAAAAAAV